MKTNLKQYDIGFVAQDWYPSITRIRIQNRKLVFSLPVTEKIVRVTFFRIKFIMSLLWENRWFEKEIISVLRLTRKWSSQSISNSEVFFRHFWRFELGTIISKLFLDFQRCSKIQIHFINLFIWQSDLSQLLKAK